MKGLRFLITITQRQYDQAYLDYFARNGISTVFSSICNGTASHSILEYLSLTDTEKIMFQAFVPAEKQKELLHGLTVDMKLSESGNGIALTVPVDGIGGASALNYLVGENALHGEEDVMEEIKHVLIIAVVNKGYSDEVMDAARAVDARGGTIVRARGTGEGFAEKFFGVSITDEKEMVYIVAKKENRDNIMHAIMEHAGAGTEAHGAVFSLPVDSVTGMRSLLD